MSSGRARRARSRSASRPAAGPARRSCTSPATPHHPAGRHRPQRHRRRAADRAHRPTDCHGIARSRPRAAGRRVRRRSPSRGPWQTTAPALRQHNRRPDHGRAAPWPRGRKARAPDRRARAEHHRRPHRPRPQTLLAPTHRRRRPSARPAEPGSPSPDPRATQPIVDHCTCGNERRRRRSRIHVQRANEVDVKRPSGECCSVERQQ
jgi:hypothetical protein